MQLWSDAWRRFALQRLLQRKQREARQILVARAAHIAPCFLYRIKFSRFRPGAFRANPIRQMMKNGNQDQSQIRNAGENARTDLPKLNALDVILVPPI